MLGFALRCETSRRSPIDALVHSISITEIAFRWNCDDATIAEDSVFRIINLQEIRERSRRCLTLTDQGLESTFVTVARCFIHAPAHELATVGLAKVMETGICGGSALPGLPRLEVGLRSLELQRTGPVQCVRNRIGSVEQEPHISGERWGPIRD